MSMKVLQKSIAILLTASLAHAAGGAAVAAPFTQNGPSAAPAPALFTHQALTPVAANARPAISQTGKLQEFNTVRSAFAMLASGQAARDFRAAKAVGNREGMNQARFVKAAREDAQLVMTLCERMLLGLQSNKPGWFGSIYLDGLQHFLSEHRRARQMLVGDNFVDISENNWLGFSIVLEDAFSRGLCALLSQLKAAPVVELTEDLIRALTAKVASVFEMFNRDSDLRGRAMAMISESTPEDEGMPLDAGAYYLAALGIDLRKKKLGPAHQHGWVRIGVTISEEHLEAYRAAFMTGGLNVGHRCDLFFYDGKPIFFRSPPLAGDSVTPREGVRTLLLDPTSALKLPESQGPTGTEIHIQKPSAAPGVDPKAELASRPYAAVSVVETHWKYPGHFERYGTSITRLADLGLPIENPLIVMYPEDAAHEQAAILARHPGATVVPSDFSLEGLTDAVLDLFFLAMGSDIAEIHLLWTGLTYDGCQRTAFAKVANYLARKPALNVAIHLFGPLSGDVIPDESDFMLREILQSRKGADHFLSLPPEEALTWAKRMTDAMQPMTDLFIRLKGVLAAANRGDDRARTLLMDATYAGTAIAAGMSPILYVEGVRLATLLAAPSARTLTLHYWTSPESMQQFFADLPRLCAQAA